VALAAIAGVLALLFAGWATSMAMSLVSASVAPALAIGIPAQLATSRLLASQLYRVAARDPLTLSSVAVLLSVVAMGAAFRPARLASRIDPMALLRHE
jgi:ABC-type antimicrobial peptide transport system permease subunit